MATRKDDKRSILMKMMMKKKNLKNPVKKDAKGGPGYKDC